LTTAVRRHTVLFADRLERAAPEPYAN